VDGLLNLDEFADETGVDLPEGPYETVAGYVLSALGRLPSVGDTVEVAGRRLTVIEMDARRIARVRVGPAADGPPADPAHPTGPAAEAATRTTPAGPGQHVPPAQ
jgi:putative hemolysin